LDAEEFQLVREEQGEKRDLYMIGTGLMTQQNDDDDDYDDGDDDGDD
jgi:hypothetical protein